MEHLSNDYEDCDNHKLCNEMEHPILSFTKSHWKLKQPHDQNFPWRESHCKILVTEERNKPEIVGL